MTTELKSQNGHGVQDMVPFGNNFKWPPLSPVNKGEGAKDHVIKKRNLQNPLIFFFFLTKGEGSSNKCNKRQIANDPSPDPSLRALTIF